MDEHTHKIYRKGKEDLELDLSDPANKCMLCGSSNIDKHENSYNAHLWVKCKDCSATYHLNRSKK